MAANSRAMVWAGSRRGGIGGGKIEEGLHGDGALEAALVAKALEEPVHGGQAFVAA